MTKTIFHILDAIAQDVEEEGHLEPSGNLTDDDDEVKPVRGGKKAGQKVESSANPATL
jgi:hypothetical protein